MKKISLKILICLVSVFSLCFLLSTVDVKADVNETGKPDAWNKSTLKSDGRWRDEVWGDRAFEPGIYPYVAYKGTMNSLPSNSHADIRPGNYSLSQSDLSGFELFSVKTSSATY